MKSSCTIIPALLMVFFLGVGTAQACPDTEVQCWGRDSVTGNYMVDCGTVTVAACYNAEDLTCAPCEIANNKTMWHYVDDCEKKHPDCCKEDTVNGIHDGCATYWSAGRYSYHYGSGPWNY